MNGASYVHCGIFSSDFSTTSGGAYDVKHHVESNKHCECAYMNISLQTD